MKFLITLYLTLFSALSFGQTMVSDTVYQPMFFLDSIQININRFFFSPDKINNVSVVKGDLDPVTKTKGKVYINSKDPKDFNFISFDELKSKYTSSNNSPIIFILDDKFLLEKSKFYKIDSSYILRIVVLKGSDFEDLKTNFPDLAVIRIITKSKENIDDQNKIHIR